MEKKELLKCIENGMLAAEMAVKFKIHDLDLYREINKLENSGYTLGRNYYSDGNFKYTFKANDLSNDKETNIITKSDEKDIRVLCISDLHYTSKFQNLDLVHKAYDYAKRNGINLIFIGGDILHGKFGYSESTFEDGLVQIEKFLNDYPFNNNILTFAVGGDHDESIYHNDYINPIDVITKKRHDIIIPNYVYSPLKIKDARIGLKHKKASGGNPLNIELPDDYEVLLNGHHHRYDFSSSGGRVDINLPAACNITETINGYVVLTLHYSCNHLDRVESDYISYINGKEVTLVHNGSNVSFKTKTKTNIEDYNHSTIINPYKKSVFTDDNDELNSLRESVKEKEVVEESNTKLSKENEELSLLLDEAKEENKRLEEKIKKTKEEKAKQTDKISMLTKEGRSILESNKKLSSNNKELKQSNEDYRAKNEELEQSNENYKSQNQELLQQLNEYKRLLEEYQNNEKKEETISKETDSENLEKALNDINEHKEAVRKTCERMAEILRNNDEEALRFQENPIDTEEEIHELFKAVASLDKKKDEDFYKEFKRKRMIEFAKYLYKSKKEEEATPVVEATLVEENDKDLNDEFYYSEFRKERIEEFKKYLKRQAKKEEKSKPTILAVSPGRTFLHEALKTIENAPVSAEQLENDEFREKMCDVMEAAAFSMSGEEEKKRILKVNKSIKKDEKFTNSQLSKQERIEQLKRKMGCKTR